MKLASTLLALATVSVWAMQSTGEELQPLGWDAPQLISGPVEVGQPTNSGTMGTIVMQPVATSPTVAPPAYLPPKLAPPVVTYRPVTQAVVPVNPYYVGRGLLGQPKLYVDGQPFRNFLRSLSF